MQSSSAERGVAATHWHDATLHEFRDRTVDGKSIVDMGAPLGQSLRVTNTGLSPTKNDLGGYSILQAESKEALAAELKGHPHFTMPEGFIEIVEIMPVPGT